MSANPIEIVLEQQEDYRFLLHFGPDTPPLLCDEPPPLGHAQGPSPVQLLAGAVGNCLADSLLFALRKFKQQPEPIRCAVQAEVGRNPEGRMRVLGMVATLDLGVPADSLQHLDRVLEQFEAFCTVTQSVGQGIPIAVVVRDATGRVLKGQPQAVA